MSVVPPPPPHRRLSARRGSTTAPDPFGVHATVNLNPNRSSSSRLTIVRVPTVATPTPLSLNEPPASPVLGQRRLHRRPAPPANSTDRVSFAFSSFGPSQRTSSDSPDHSPSSSPRLRPSSPHLSATHFSGQKPRLTPDQLVDLARTSTVPRPQLTPNTDPSSPPVNQTLPATFTPLPDDIYLPFIDRPSEVSQLISSPPDVKLFSLLAQTFRNKLPTLDHDSAVETHVDLPRDPALWTYNHLVYHLTRIDRDIAPDFIWAIAARKCILAHSELLWERIKGALGIPPELDVDYDFLDDDQESPDTSDISDDEGRGARGHWSDWDAVMDSPIHTRKRLSMSESPAPSVHSGRRVDDQEAHFRSQIDDKLHGLRGGFVQSSTTTNESEDGDATIAPTPHGVRSPPDQEGIVIGNFSPPILPEGTEYLSIEPLLAPASSPSVLFHPLTNPPPLSLPSSLTPNDALGDIAEGAEEEEAEQESVTEVASPSGEQGANNNPIEEDPDMISPSQIQGLRISTSPLPPSQSFGTPPILSPISPLPPYPPPNSNTNAVSIPGQTLPSSGSYTSSQPHSRTSSFSSVGPFQRSESTGNLSASWSAMAATAAAAAGNNSGSYAGSVIGSDAGDSSGYISDGDRLPGNPLFPSNFARLAGGPTLRANTSSGRSAHVIPHTRYAPSSNSTASTFSGPSLAHRPGKVRAYSHGASTVGGTRIGAMAAHQQSQSHSASAQHAGPPSSSSSSSSVSGGGNLNRRSWGDLSGARAAGAGADGKE